MKQLARRVLHRYGFDIVRTTNLHGDQADHLRNVLAARKVDCVIDVGANAGQYGEFLRRLGYTGHIVSFEPVRSVFETLRAKCAQDDKWTCYNIALGDQNNEKTMNVYASTVFSSLLEANDYAKQIWRSLEDVTQEQVTVARLDDIYADAIGALGPTNCLLKIDTQGYDKRVFDGARGSLAHVAAMQSELSMIPVYQGSMPAYVLLTAFEQAGYYISGMYPINRDTSLAVIEFDCVLVKR